VAEERFPYEQSSWSNDKEQRRRWYEVLERTGPANVRARLAQTNTGSRSAVFIGEEVSMTKGFAEEWLAWHDRRKAEREDGFRRDQIFWTRWAALAATLAAIAAAVGLGAHVVAEMVGTCAGYLSLRRPTRRAAITSRSVVTLTGT
jgi:hypothetical protein